MLVLKCSTRHPGKREMSKCPDVAGPIFDHMDSQKGEYIGWRHLWQLRAFKEEATGGRFIELKSFIETQNIKTM